MKLVNYGVGEISDRLSILALKILFGAEGGKDTAHFSNERVVLLTQLRGRTLNGKWFDAYTDLAAVNSALWHAEDDLRELRAGPAFMGLSPVSAAAEKVAGLAFRIQVLNDQRAALIERINQEAGDTLGTEREKLT